MNVGVRELMLAGAHFGHRARFWNPKMAPYIYGEYNKTHVINLDHTVAGLRSASDFLQSIVADGGKVLYLSTKTVAHEAIEENAKSVNMPFLNKRWLGGMLTNFKTMRNSVDRFLELEARIADGVLKEMTKKEGIKLILQRDKLERAIGGVRDMQDLPDAIFVIDAGWHKGAIREAKKLGIPIVAVVDSNHSPDDIDYVIPGNDDSRQAIDIYIKVITTAIRSGKQDYDDNLAQSVREAANISEKEGAKATPAKGAAVPVKVRNEP